MNYIPSNNFLDNYLPYDGTIEFYSRISTITNENSIVLDLGAGRGEWLDDNSAYRIKSRFLKDKVYKLIGIDVSNEVLKNTSTNENHIIKNGIFPIDDNSIDVIISDYVF
jgi:hypothetical protein